MEETKQNEEDAILVWLNKNSEKFENKDSVAVVCGSSTAMATFSETWGWHIVWSDTTVRLD